MRKKTIKHLFDTIFWYVIYLLPIIFLVFAWCKGNTDFNLNNVFIVEGLDLGVGFALSTEHPLLMPFIRVFGPSGIFPLFHDPGVLFYLIYFINCWILHLAVDVLLFIVRWSHSMIDGFLGGKHD